MLVCFVSQIFFCIKTQVTWITGKSWKIEYCWNNICLKYNLCYCTTIITILGGHRMKKYADITSFFELENNHTHDAVILKVQEVERIKNSVDEKKQAFLVELILNVFVGFLLLKNHFLQVTSPLFLQITVILLPSRLLLLLLHLLQFH